MVAFEEIWVHQVFFHGMRGSSHYYVVEVVFFFHLVLRPQSGNYGAKEAFCFSYETTILFWSYIVSFWRKKKNTVSVDQASKYVTNQEPMLPDNIIPFIP